MKIKQLIKRLQQLDQDMFVLSWSDYHNDFMGDCEVNIHNPETIDIRDPFHSERKLDMSHHVKNGTFITIDYIEE